MVSEKMAEILIRTRCPMAQIAQKSGVSETSLRNWAKGTINPSLDMAEWVLNALGYRLEVVKVEKECATDKS